MDMVRRIAHKIRRTYHQSLHSIVARRILETPPITIGMMPLTVLSMVHNRDVMTYLVAIKSFARYVNPRRIVIVCDPSITEYDRYYIKSQIPHIVMRQADEFTHRDIPRGGTWERLYAIAEYAQTDYVVQLDADTITMRPPAEVIKAITERTGFVIGERANQEISTLAESAAWSRQHHTDLPGIQCVVEANLDKDQFIGTHYVRGCSGFTGFPPSADIAERLLAFSATMRARHQARWDEWSTEQITSNYLVSNLPGTKVLPFPEYGTPDVLTDKSTFMHFMGYLRFINGKYRIATKNAIAQMKTAKNESVAGVTIAPAKMELH